MLRDIEIILAVLIPLSLGAAVTSTNTNAGRNRQGLDMVEYLERYGYLDSGFNPQEDGREIFHSEAALQYAIRKFQEFNKLTVTGRMNKETSALMGKPRCGFKDIITEFDPSQPQRFTHLGTKWPKNKITWKQVTWTNKLPHYEQKRAVKKAFQYWADVTPLTFSQTEGTPDIEIKFANGEHGDGVYNAFDGKGNTLAHAFGPGNVPISGDTHFDSDEDWVYHTSRGTELETVAAHEFGHALGLGHSSVPGSLMAPYYQGYNPNLKLHHDDVRGIQLLYGSKAGRTTATPTTTSTTTSDNNPEFCKSKLDAIVTASDGFTYAFRYNKVFKIGSVGLVEGYPRLTRELYPRAPSNIRGAFYLPNDRKTYIFKGSRLWRYTDFKLDEGFPKYIYTTNFPEKLHAVLTLKDKYGQYRVFMFGSDMFWEWNPKTLQMIPGWAYPITRHWRGIPQGVEAAVTWYDNHMYFFKGANYRKFDNASRSVRPGYPTNWAPMWMRNVCK